MHSAHAQTDGLASVANVSALMLYPSVINQTFSCKNEVKRSGCSRPAKTNVYLYCYVGQQFNNGQSTNDDNCLSVMHITARSHR